jgi:tetratricopeptide (TPR) repeat protein
MNKINNLNKLSNKAKSLIKLKKFDKAIPIYEAILEIDNMHPIALSHLGIIFLMKERYEEAIEVIEKSFKVLNPAVGDFQNLATAYIGLKDYDNAINAYQRIIQIEPNNQEIFKILGDLQMKVADHPAALDSYKNALNLEPEKFEALYDFGVVLHVNKYHDEAIEILSKAHKIDPNHIECMNKMASCLSAVGNYNEAKIKYKKLINLVPDALAPVIDYASCLIYEGKYDEAIEMLKEILVKKPNDSVARSNLSLLYLTNKNFKEGWVNYEARILMRNEFDVTKRHDKLKSILEIDVGKKILKAEDKIIILLDAGIGDAILASSMLKEFHKKYKNISAEVDYRLLDLFKRSFPEIQFYPIREKNHEIYIEYDPTIYDKGIYWMSLGKYVREDITKFPKDKIDFLKPKITKVNEIKDKIKKDKSIICGISWKSAAAEDRHKSSKLQDLLPIFSIEDTRFIDLQYENKEHLGKAAIEKKEILKNNNIEIEDYEGIDKFEDIDSLAALISNLDIVVTCSNVTAHIAGGLGKKTLLFVPYSRGRLWYWHDKGGYSIWYPSVRIFRAESIGSWGNIFEQMAKEIKLK